MSRRAAAVVVVVIAGSPGAAVADHGGEAVTSYEVALLMTRVDVGGRAIPGKLVRFGPRIVIREHLELGCDLDVGSVAGDAPVRPIARTTGGGGSVGVQGRISAAKMMAGGHWNAGRLGAGVDLAVGLHAAELTDDLGRPVEDVWPVLVAEGRSHLDAWITPHLTVGLAASLDLETRRDVAVGVVLGLHPIAFAAR